MSEPLQKATTDDCRKIPLPPGLAMQYSLSPPFHCIPSQILASHRISLLTGGEEHDHSPA